MFILMIRKVEIKLIAQSKFGLSRLYLMVLKPGPFESSIGKVYRLENVLENDPCCCRPRRTIKGYLKICGEG